MLKNQKARHRSMELDRRLSKIAREGASSSVDERRKLLEDMLHEEDSFVRQKCSNY